MAEGKKSFVAYCDWGEIFDELSDGEAGRLAKHLFDYVRDKDPKPKDKITGLMFIQIKQSLKRDLVKYDKYVDKQRVNGSKGGRPKKTQTEPKKPKPFPENPTEPKKADSVTVNVSVTDNDSVTNKEIPTLEEFINFGLSKEPLLLKKSLELKYESWKINDWKDGNHKEIKNWKTKLLNTIQYLEKEKSSAQKDKFDTSIDPDNVNNYESTL